MAPDDAAVVFHLERDAKFHDGTPVTAAAVRWLFGRTALIGGFPALRFGAARA